MELLDKDFENFFGTLKKENFSVSDLELICKPLLDYQRKKNWKRWFKIVLSFAVIYSLIQWSDGLNWFLSALGRILLIQILPMWNWSKLYNAKCLIERPINSNSNIKSAATIYSPDMGNCLLCENIDYVPTVSNITFSILENKYLEMGLPVLITDSHDVESAADLFHTIFSKSFSFLESSHCDVSTNLIIKKFFNAEIALRKAWKLLDTSEKWFIQLRNCQSSAVRSSRLFIKRPYYYPGHQESFYSSWLIMSQHFNHQVYQEIQLQGLIIIQQLSGSTSLRLMPKKPCDENCPMINIQLKAGEAFVFSTDLWLLHYRHVKGQHPSITTIMEIDWSV